ncbi:unnamed protein product [Diatraea saccharalis]|uniref:Retrotransposon gag domain-containing protein n=1 Tax=Diatraea saccharalis TaxID=40085 RepID=A0A9N9R418_9NEOP|nr:unnamed protein product [Diatraea saccharalis]
MEGHVLVNIIEFFNKNTKFSRWQCRLEGAFRIYDIKDEEKQKNLFLYYVGAEAYDVLCDLCSPESPDSKSYATLKKLLKDHYDPAPLEIAEYFRFHHCHQQVGESIRDYVANLRKMAATCNFGQFLNTALRNQFTCGVRDRRVRDRLLEQKNLSLDRAIQIEVSMENATN